VLFFHLRVWTQENAMQTLEINLRAKDAYDRAKSASKQKAYFSAGSHSANYWKKRLLKNQVTQLTHTAYNGNMALVTFLIGYDDVGVYYKELE
jgi:hypothetical protein